MLDVHPPNAAPRSWADFLVHIATITIGLLIAIGLEQTVEFFHHRHQRHELIEQLHDEAVKNREILRRDLELEAAEKWFAATRQSADQELVHFGLVNFTTPVAPCVPGKVGSDAGGLYLAPVDGVWTIARESNLVYLMPADEAHFYVRLGHNIELLLHSRENMAAACERLIALQNRFTKPSPGGTAENWTLTAEQAGRLAEASAAADAAMRGLITRVRITLGVVEYSLRDHQDFSNFDSALRDIVAATEAPAAPQPAAK